MTALSATAQSDFQPRDPDFQKRVSKSFSLQIAMQTIGIELKKVAPGMVELEMPYNEDYSQQHGFVHAGITTTALDSACAYAAFSLMPKEAAVLTVEMKSSLLAPAKGSRFIFRGSVTKPGRTLYFCDGQAWAISDTGEKLIASMSSTIMALYDRPGLRL